MKRTIVSKSVGLIPARGGSKGIFKKNIRSLGGKPLIVHTIESALKSAVDRIIVSTDDKEIADIAKKAGAEVPFLRPAAIAEDTTPDQPVMAHLLNYLDQEEAYTFDYLVYLRPTTPFKKPESINAALSKLVNAKCLSSVRSVTQAEGVHHPFWMYKPNGDELAPFCEIDPLEFYQRQKLPICYRLNGVVEILRAQNLPNKNPYGECIGFSIVGAEEALDIDTEFDFKMCDLLAEAKKNERI